MLPPLRQLQYLKLLAEHGSFSRAAEAAHVSQPALSSGVQELERILGAAVVERHGGELPSTLDELVKLPGIGRKTANVILGNAFGVPGITVDTHFGRLVRRWGWTTEEDPVKVEHAVGALFPKRDWTMLSHHLIWHGRRRCHAQKPACGACPVARWCPAYGAGPTDPVVAEKLVRTEGRA